MLSFSSENSQGAQVTRKAAPQLSSAARAATKAVVRILISLVSLTLSIKFFC
jgi:hypothetical protein